MRGLRRGSRQVRQLRAKVEEAGLHYHDVARGRAAADKLDRVEAELLEDCRALARAAADRGEQQALRRTLRETRKLASLLSCGDAALLRRFIVFTDAVYRDAGDEDA